MQKLDLSRGKTYEKLDRLKNEIDHATYLLRGLKAETRLTGDMDMVSCLVMKLPIHHRQDWVKWSTTHGGELHPGENEWPVFLLWLERVRKTALKGRVYDDQDTRPLPTRAPQKKPRTMELINAQDGEYVESAEVNAAYRGRPTRKLSRPNLGFEDLVQTARWYTYGNARRGWAVQISSGTAPNSWR